MHADILLKGRVYCRGDFLEGCVGVTGGEISFIGKEVNAPSYDEKTDFGRLLILPGLIDIHAHLRGLRLKHKEDFLTGTSAAAAGGFTLVLDMPNTAPSTNSRIRMVEKMEEAGGEIVVDVGFYFGRPEGEEEAEKLLETGAVGLKLYPEDYSGAGRQDVSTVVRKTLEGRSRVVFHPENLSIIEDNRRNYPESLKGVDKHGFIRPLEAELSALDVFSRVSGPGAHATHLTSVSSLGKARDKGFTCDVSVNHLTLTEKDLLRLGGVCKVNPPLRSSEERTMLAESLNNGGVPILATDHAPHTLEEKNNTLYDEVPSGIPCFETAFAALLDRVNTGELSLHRIIEAFTRGPAGFLGDDRIGVIRESCVASMTIVDPKEEWRVDPEEFYTKAKHSPFSGRRLRGRVKATMLRGEFVFKEGEITVQKGFGRIYRCKHEG